MKKIGFVIPWYSGTIPGGAEAALRGLAEHLLQAKINVEVLTTCVKEFSADWNVNFYSKGISYENGVAVRRFAIDKCDREIFRDINKKVMQGEKVSLDEEQHFLQDMVNSKKMYQYMKKHRNEYSLFVLTPYMFGTTYYGSMIAPEKTVLIPCFHDEGYVYFKHFQNTYSKVAGMIFLAKPEQELASKLYSLSDMKIAVLGTGIDTHFTGDPVRFREKYKINYPFILYAGRKEVGKNIYTLIHYFAKYKSRKHEMESKQKLKLVLIGGGTVSIPKEIKKDVIDLGFVDKQDKFDAYAAANFMCQPSHNESFSLVIMESWLMKRPVIVCEQCEVTTNFVRETNGGLYFNNYHEFEGVVDFLMERPNIADIMGEKGREYVLENFSWNVIVENYMEFFKIVGK